jgi:allene oxide cyclase
VHGKHRRVAKSARAAAVLFAAGSVVIGSLAVAVSSAGAAARVHASAGRTVHVIEHAVTDTVVQSGGKGDKTGNLLTFHNFVYNTGNTKRVGHDQGVCVRIFPPEGSWECMWTTFLAGGQITVEGPYYDTHNSVLAITGGTGAYRNARGQMSLLARDGGKEYDFIFQIS